VKAFTFKDWASTPKKLFQLKLVLKLFPRGEEKKKQG